MLVVVVVNSGIVVVVVFAKAYVTVIESMLNGFS
jgi:hypothetical protein